MTRDYYSSEEIERAFEKAQKVWAMLVAEEPDAVGLEPIMTVIVQEMILVLDKQILVGQPSEVARSAFRAAKRIRPLIEDPGMAAAVGRAIRRLAGG